MWRGHAGGLGASKSGAQAKPTSQFQKYAWWAFNAFAVISFMAFIVYLGNQPHTPGPRRLKRGELAKKHREYMESQARTKKNYYFPHLDFEPDFSAVKTLQPTCADRCSAEVCEYVHRSTLHSACCSTNVTKDTWIFPLLITATPRSGTVATLNLFRTLGLELGDDWDKIGKHGRISWIHGFNELYHVQKPGNQEPMAYYGQPHMRLVGDRFRVIIHLVRDPLSSITSIACTEPLADIQWSEYVRTKIHMQGWGSDRKDFYIAMKMWLDWHEFLDNLCSFRIRLEDLFDMEKGVGIIEDIFTLINQEVPTAETVHSAITAVKTEKRQNKRDHRPKITWQELFKVDADLARKTYERSCQYGYHCDDVIDGMDSEQSMKAVTYPVCEFEEDTERGWSPGRVSALSPEMKPK